MHTPILSTLAIAFAATLAMPAAAQTVVPGDTANDADYPVIEADAGLIFEACEPYAATGARCALTGAVDDQHLCVALGADGEPVAQETLLPGTPAVTFGNVPPEAIAGLRCRKLIEDGDLPPSPVDRTEEDSGG